MLLYDKCRPPPFTTASGFSRWFNTVFAWFIVFRLVNKTPSIPLTPLIRFWKCERKDGHCDASCHGFDRTRARGLTDKTGHEFEPGPFWDGGTQFSSISTSFCKTVVHILCKSLILFL